MSSGYRLQQQLRQRGRASLTRHDWSQFIKFELPEKSGATIADLSLQADHIGIDAYKRTAKVHTLTGTDSADIHEGSFDLATCD